MDDLAGGRARSAGGSLNLFHKSSEGVMAHTGIDQRAADIVHRLREGELALEDARAQLRRELVPDATPVAEALSDNALAAVCAHNITEGEAVEDIVTAAALCDIDQL
ncbi:MULTISPECIES: hypothetical protein [Asticcacaulis]|uniref:hypothetical protein n=1 Tax=Asticcacaulis TaxID=76890 RepID=UPI001AE2A594|nr:MULTISPECIES: hypothetical protein [Asticcacaulis]MBP2157820.1 sugar (pentulose or hexulose) kinase [Asticcacaulis solisilvae]MDR6798865.1 sugar (pentulose or hexulose) kinase [Asticcacaulis sp. BE141]